MATDRDGALERVRSFFAEKIWSTRVSDLRRGRALAYRASRVAYSSVQGFVSNRLTVRAAALTYYSVLSIVPFLAFAFAVLKGFGAYASFVDGTVRPWVQATFGRNAALLESIERILQFVDRTNVSTLGVLGLLTLVYTCVSLLSSVEETLNEIWGATTKRSFLRQVTDYVTLLVTAPLLVATAGGVATAAQSSRFVGFLRDALGLGDVIDLLLHFAPLAAVALAFFAAYTILPNVRTRPVSALLGAVVAAVLWELALVLYVRFQMGVSSYNALYSVLSAIPIFLVWTYISWVVVLVGAQVAASHQNERLARQRFRAQHADQALRERLAVVIAAHVAQSFLAGAPSRSPAALAEVVSVPPLTVEDILEALVRAGVLARAATGGELRYLPARDVDALRVEDVRDALRRDVRAEVTRAEVDRRLAPGLRRLLDEADEDRRTSSHNLTLRELAGLVAAPGTAAEGAAQATPATPAAPPRPPLAAAPAPPAAGARPVLDAK